MKKKPLTLIFMSDAGVIFLVWEEKNRAYFENRHGVISTHQVQEFYSCIANDILNDRLFLVGKM
jgi:hypothetical protein